MASSTYVSLQGESRKFRLLILEPSTDRLAPVRCTLNQASFDDDDLKYTALSYVWGDPLDTTPVLVNGIERQITLNLESALRHIRKASCAVVLWVDALCINQEDEAEKNHQVEMMREIFSGAELVIAWLGSAGEDSDIAMEILGKGLKGWTECPVTQYESIRMGGQGCQRNSTANNKQKDDMRGKDYEGDLATPPAQDSVEALRRTITGPELSTPEIPSDLEVAGSLSDDEDERQDEARIIGRSGISSHSQRSGSSDSEVSDGSDFSDNFRSAFQGLTTCEALAIHRLLTRSWWSRIWVVQEVFLAKMLLFKCGDDEISGDKMSSWGRGELLLVMNHTVSDGGISIGYIFPTMAIFETLNDLTTTAYNATDYLSLYGKREATRPHDHIYGILGIISPDDRVLLGTPDYSCRVEDLFISVVIKLMVNQNSLELLLETGVPQALATATSTHMDLPSWVPDWTQTRVMNTHFSRWKGSLKSISKPLFHFSEDAKELVLEGFKFDVIESVQPVPTYGQGKMPIWQADLTTKEGTAEGEQPPLHMLIVALCLLWSDLERLDDEDGFIWIAAFLRELEEYSIGRREASDDCDYLAGFLEWIEETRDDRTDEEILEKIFNVEAARSFVKWYHKNPNKEVSVHYWIYTTFTRQSFAGNALMFRTYRGSFGIMQAEAAAGDLLCVVPGCAVMLVFRKTQSSRYLVVGPSSPIAGTLHGEVAQAIERGEITKEFFTLV